MLLFFHNGRTAKKQCRQDACTALDWVAGLFFQSGRLLGLIMQAIATIDHFHEEVLLCLDF